MLAGRIRDQQKWATWQGTARASATARRITTLDWGWNVVIYSQRDIRRCSCCTNPAVVRPLFTENRDSHQDHFCNMHDVLCAAMCVPAPSQMAKVKPVALGALHYLIQSSRCVVVQSLQNAIFTPSCQLCWATMLQSLHRWQRGRVSNYECCSGAGSFSRHDVRLRVRGDLGAEPSKST